MATIVTKNKYETARAAYEHEVARGNQEKAEQALKLMDNYKATQDKQIVLGSLCRLHYRRYWNDPNPLALIMSYTKKEYRCVAAVNLHYLTTNHAMLVINKVMKQNKMQIKNGRALQISYDMFTNLGLPLISYRLYKWDKIKPMEYIPIDDWETTVKKEKSVWQGKLYSNPTETKKKRKKSRTKLKKKLRKRRG